MAKIMQKYTFSAFSQQNIPLSLQLETLKVWLWRKEQETVSVENSLAFTRNFIMRDVNTPTQVTGQRVLSLLSCDKFTALSLPEQLLLLSCASAMASWYKV